ncbi:MAG: type I DNA topoisomerase, partial [Dehalococcoidia bacterium]
MTTKTGASSRTTGKTTGKTAAKKTTAKRKTTKAKGTKAKSAAVKLPSSAGKSLVIVESPAKARTVGQILGRKYVVTASQGHVRDLPKSKIGVDIEQDFEPSYVIMKDKRSLLTQIKKAGNEAKEIFLATDPDREGEAISWHLQAAAEWQDLPTPPKRVVFHEITKEAVEEAFRNPREIDMQLVNAQQARRILDRLVGYQISPLLWRRVQRGTSAGRVQSVSLRMVVDREREIEAFVPVESWTIDNLLRKVGEEQTDKNQFSAALHSVKGERARINIPDEENARRYEAELANADYKVAEVRKRDVRQRPSAPFTTSTMQQESGRKLRFTAQRTMSVAQQLYEGLTVGSGGPIGLITYMRTDSTQVAASAIAEVREYIQGRYGKDHLPAKPRLYTRAAKGAQEAHEAVRPTSIQRDPASLKDYLSRDQ